VTAVVEARDVDAPDLASQLADAERAALDPRMALDRVEAAVRAALERSDYAEAARLQPDVDPARQRVLIADAHVSALRSAAAALDEQRAVDQRAAQDQVRREQARHQHAIEAQAEADALAAAQRHLADVKAGLLALRQSIATGLAAEHAAGEHRQAAHDWLVQLGDREPARVGRPNLVSAQLAQDVQLAAIFRYSP
jgi:hypothetical protein